MKSPAVVNFSQKPHSVELREFSRPEPGPDDVILASRRSACAAATCTSGPSSHSWKVNYPVVLGHEFGGGLPRWASAVRAWKEGDRVVSETAAVIDADSPLSRRGPLQP
jgi:L-iditol 2-dehydrogenase